MEMQKNSSVTDFQQLWGKWTNLFNQLYEDPKVTQAMNTRAGQYLSSHPFLALTLMLFSAMAIVPVGLFLTFALVITMMLTVGFVFFEAFLLFAGGLTLLCVLSGFALFSLVAAVIFNAFYIAVSIILNYYSQATKQGKVQQDRSELEPSKLKEMQ